MVLELVVSEDAIRLQIGQLFEFIGHRSSRFVVLHFDRARHIDVSDAGLIGAANDDVKEAVPVAGLSQGRIVNEAAARAFDILETDVVERRFGVVNDHAEIDALDLLRGLGGAGKATDDGTHAT